MAFKVCPDVSPTTPPLQEPVHLAPALPATNGVVLATEKKLKSPLVDETSVKQLASITDGIGAYDS